MAESRSESYLPNYFGVEIEGIQLREVLPLRRIGERELRLRSGRGGAEYGHP